MSVDLFYLNHPWEKLAFGHHDELDPQLANIYMRSSVYTPWIQQAVDLGSKNAQKMEMTDLIPPRQTTGEKDHRTVWYNSERFDSYTRDITYKSYGGKLAFTEYDDISFWLRQGAAGLSRIVDRHMGQMVVDSLDVLSRNSFLAHPYPFVSGGGSDFNAVGAGDKITSDDIRDIWLGLEMRDRMYANLPLDDVTPMGIVCITSPGVLYDIKAEGASTNKNDYITLNKEANPSSLLRQGVSQYLDVTFIKSNMATLWNCGDTTARANIIQPASGGDGSDPAVKVYGTYAVGEVGTAGVTHYVTTNIATGLAIGDWVTIHKLTTAEFGVTGPNGVDYRDPDLHNDQIVNIVEIAVGTEYRITFRKPLMTDFATDLGAGVYGYITKGKDIHTAVFLGGNTGILRGYFQPPRILRPPTFDDAMEMRRITWKGRYGDALWEPEAFEVLLCSATSRRGFGAAVDG